MLPVDDEIDERTRMEIEAMKRDEADRAENARMVKERQGAGTTVPDLVPFPDTDDIKELCQAAAPAMIRKGINLAMKNESLPQFTTALREIMDRAYGKAEQSVKATIEHKTPFDGMNTHDLLALRDELARLIEEVRTVGAIPDVGGAANPQTGIVFPVLEAEIVSQSGSDA